jgi:hypothetical protein
MREEVWQPEHEREGEMRKREEGGRRGEEKRKMKRREGEEVC